MIKFTTSGNFNNTNRFLDKILRDDLYSRLEPLAQQGVDALRGATPIDSGETADSWDYEIVRKGGVIQIWWKNTNIENGFNVAIGLQYGHGTGAGGYVAGRDYINPALKPIFDKIADGVWEEVRRA